MSWTNPRTWNVGEIVTKVIMDLHIRDNLRYLKGLDGVPIIESGLTIDNTDGDERLLLPLLSTAECNTVLNAEGEIAFDETTHQMKEYDGTAVRVVLSEADVDDTPVNGVTTFPISSNWAYDLKTMLTTRGDVIRRGASDWERLGLGASGLYLYSDGTDVIWAAGVQGVAIYGDGSDGDVTISVDTDLARDMFYNTLTVNNTKILNAKGFRIFVRGTLTNNGIISCDGGIGSNGTADAGGAGGVSASVGSLGQTNTGGVGAVGPVSEEYRNGGGGGGGGGVLLIAARTIINNGTFRANGGNGGNGASVESVGAPASGDNGTSLTDALGGNGGKGADGAGGPEGAGGTVTNPPAEDGGFRTIPMAIQLREFISNIKIGGGAGGGGGDYVLITQGGGGGGGGGGLLVIVYTGATWGTEQASGGAVGTVNTGGVAGSAGLVIKLANA